MQMHGYELASPSASKCSVASCVAWHLAAGEEVEHRDLLGAVGALGTFIFLPLGAVKLHIGIR